MILKEIVVDELCVSFNCSYERVSAKFGWQSEYIATHCFS